MQPIQITGCVIIKDEAILLMHRIKTDWYELPGGKLELGETHEQAAVRELKEELNIDVKIIKKIGSVAFEYDGKFYDYLWQQAEILNEEQLEIMEKEKFSHFRYIKLSELQQYTLSTNVKQFIAENGFRKLG